MHSNSNNAVEALTGLSPLQRTIRLLGPVQTASLDLAPLLKNNLVFLKRKGAKHAKEGSIKSIKNDLCDFCALAVNYNDIFEKEH